MCTDTERLSFFHSHILYNSSLPDRWPSYSFQPSLSLSIDGGSIQSLLLPTSGHCILHSCRLLAGYFGQFTPNILSLYNIPRWNGDTRIPTWHSTEPHCTENLKHISPEMKLRGLVPIFYLHSCIWERIYLFPLCRSYLESIFSCIAWENSWLNRRRGEKGRDLLPSSGWWQFPALPSAPAVEPRIHINEQHTNFQFAKIWIINGNNLSFS